jgi:glycosyltransferase involved in cell wall biosynthesis
MRILMFGWEFPPYNSGGLGVACYGLARALAREGVEVLFVLPKKAPVSLPGVRFIFADEANPMDDRFIHTLQSGYISEDQFRFMRGKYPELAGFGWDLYSEVMKYAARAELIAAQEDFDVIHAHDWLSFPAGLSAKQVSGKPLVAHVHATEFDRSGGKVHENSGVAAIERRAVHEADQVIAVSQLTKDILVERYGAPAHKIDVVHNGIDDDDAVISNCTEQELYALKENGTKIVLFVGRITLQKGPDYFLQAARKVLEHEKNVMFVISGSGDMDKQVIDSAAYHQLGKHVCFTGFMRGEDLARLYKMSDLVIMPSVSEPFGIVPLEAMRNGTPVMISNQSGVSEVVRHALKVDFWDTDEMANKILSIIHHDALGAALSENGYREVVQQVWRKAARACMMIYDKVRTLVTA